FTANAGDTISFDFDFLSNDLVPGSTGPGLDFAFVVVDGTASLLSDGPSGCTSYPPAPAPPYAGGSLVSPTGLRFDCGYQFFSATLQATGTHYVGVGVVDGSLDNYFTSAILVDNVSLSAVPEPATWMLLGSGMCLLAGLKRIKSRAVNRDKSDASS